MSDKILVEGTRHNFWGSGLSFRETISTLPNQWPGSNELGKALMELRQSLHLLNSSEKQAPKRTVLIGDSNLKEIDTLRLKIDAKHICYKIKDVEKAVLENKNSDNWY